MNTEDCINRAGVMLMRLMGGKQRMCCVSLSSVHTQTCCIQRATQLFRS